MTDAGEVRSRVRGASERVDGDVRHEVGTIAAGELSCYYYLHEPVAGPRGGIVFCPSFFEMKTLQAAELSFARQVAARGWAGLYLQPPGVGESGGGPEDASFAGRVAGALRGAAWLHSRLLEGATVGFFGARLGGLVAAHSALRAEASFVAMWDPVLSGSEYLAQARRLDRIASLAARRAGRGSIEHQLEERGWATLLGNVLSRAAFDELSALEAPTHADAPVPGHLVALNEGARTKGADRLGGAFAPFSSVHVGKRDLGHLGFGAAEADDAAPHTLEWLNGIA